jgi:1-acyl-sn-glycerol-3-phosphate acyltransferase
VTNASVHQGATALQDNFRRLAAPIARRLWNFTLEGFDRLPASGPAILCPNHVSFLDSAFLMLMVPRRISFVGKAEYMDSWKTSRLFPALGMIPIDRAGGDRSKSALDAAGAVLRRGELFGIFAEGTRSRDGRLYRGHTGAARLALEVGCPIFPVGVVGTREIQPPEARKPRLGQPCAIRIGRPLHVGHHADHHDDRLALRDLTDEVMFEIRELTGQEYVDQYATKKPEGLGAIVARPAPAVVDRERELTSVV